MAKVLTLTCVHTDTLYVPEYICASRHVSSYSGPSRSVYNLVCTELICTDSHHKPGKFVLFTLSQICSKAFQMNLLYFFLKKSISYYRFKRFKRRQATWPEIRVLSLLLLYFTIRRLWLDFTAFAAGAVLAWKHTLSTELLTVTAHE